MQYTRMSYWPPRFSGRCTPYLSRKAVFEQVDACLTRLGTDYVDLLQIHRFDPETPVAETMEALHDVVKAGKARYLGASSMWAWQFAKMQHRRGTWLESRHLDAGPVQPAAPRGGAGDVRPARRPGRQLDPWSPLAAGAVTRPWGQKGTSRAENNPTVDMFSRPLLYDSDEEIVGVTKPDHLADAVAALDFELTDDETAALEKPYVSRQPTYF